jgi:hypothetical protein
MKDRNFRFAVIAVFVFIYGAKLVSPYEESLNEYGFIVIFLIMLFFTLITYVIELLINKLMLRFFGSANKTN